MDTNVDMNDAAMTEARRLADYQAERKRKKQAAYRARKAVKESAFSLEIFDLMRQIAIAATTELNAFRSGTYASANAERVIAFVSKQDESMVPDALMEAVSELEIALDAYNKFTNRPRYEDDSIILG